VDIDIDTISTFDITKVIGTAVRATKLQDNKLKKHPVGIYLQYMAQDPLTKRAAIPYDIADKYGYTKIDILHLSALDVFDDKEQIKVLLKVQPDWSLLETEENVNKLFQIANHFKIINRIKPKNIMELADCIAFIRPGKFKWLQLYNINKKIAREKLYTKELSSDYKKSHAVAYAHIIFIQLHLLKAGVI
jgi:hypothetical protein